MEPRTPIPGSAGDRTVGNVWAWGYSNVLTNNLRGVFAEFLVGTALGAVGAVIALVELLRPHVEGHAGGHAGGHAEAGPEPGADGGPS